MSTGDSLIDNQHKTLILKFNEFSEVIQDGGDTRTAAGEILDFLQFYALWHFKREEECMAQHACPAAAENKCAHKQFITVFGGFYEKWHAENMNQELVLQTHKELENWLVNHILRIDTQLKASIELS
jgi:hemerythrin